MNCRQSVALAMALVTTAGFQARAVVTEVNVSVEPKVSSAFVWRGEILNDEWCFQPTLGLQGSNFSLRAFGNWNLTSVTNSPKNTRVDTTLQYMTTTDSQILKAGLVAYIYRDSPSQGPDDTFEVYVRDTVDVLLLPSLAVYYDFSDIQGFYATFSLAHGFTLVEDTLSLDVRTTLGAGDKKYNEAVFGQPEEDPSADIEATDVDRTALVDLTVEVSLPLQPRDGLTITPAVKYMSLMDSNIRDAADRTDQDRDIFYYTLAVEYAF